MKDAEIAHKISEGYCGGNGESERAKRNSLYIEVLDALKEARAQAFEEAEAEFKAWLIKQAKYFENSTVPHHLARKLKYRKRAIREKAVER